MEHIVASAVTWTTMIDSKVTTSTSSVHFGGMVTFIVLIASDEIRSFDLETPAEPTTIREFRE